MIQIYVNNERTRYFFDRNKQMVFNVDTEEYKNPKTKKEKVYTRIRFKGHPFAVYHSFAPKRGMWNIYSDKYLEDNNLKVIKKGGVAVSDFNKPTHEMVMKKIDLQKLLSNHYEEYL